LAGGGDELDAVSDVKSCEQTAAVCLHDVDAEAQLRGCFGVGRSLPEIPHGESFKNTLAQWEKLHNGQ